MTNLSCIHIISIYFISCISRYMSPTNLDQIPATSNTPVSQPIPTPIQNPTQLFQQQLMNKKTISTKTLVIGCGTFFLFFLIIVLIAFMVALQNPSSIEWLGITPDTVKTVVKGIILFIALIFFFTWFGLSVWSGYKLFTKKEGSKVAFIVALVMWFVLVMTAIIGGTIGITKVNAMDTSGNNASMIINPYLIVKQTNDRRIKNGKIYLGEPGLKVIAPASIVYQYNADTFNRLIGITLNGQIASFLLDCGNGQMIDSARVAFDNEWFFGNACLYLKKGTYDQSLTYRYIDRTTNQLKESTLNNLMQIDVQTEIELNTKAWPYTLNDAKNEIIIGENPSQLIVNATKIASDLNLVNSAIDWDMDNDGQTDKQKVNFSHYYYTPKLHIISYSIPEYPGIIYQFAVRVNQSNVPGCTVSAQAVENNNYRLKVDLSDVGAVITQYQFEIVDKLTDEIVDRIESASSSYVYSFAPWRQYQLRAFFTTDEGKQWVCETDDLAVNNSIYVIRSTITHKYPEDTAFTIIPISGEDNKIVLTTIPAQLKLTVDDIIPTIKKPIINVKFDGTTVLPSSQKSYLFKVEDRKNHTITITVFDEQGKSSSYQYNITANISPIIGVMKSSEKVGFDPLTVTLDASISQLNDADDEVVYFTWDFGDGTIVRNVSQWSIKHVYRFSEDNESWAYRPKVTVQTQKWFQDTIELADDIVVKRALRDVKVVSTTHPAQLARVGDEVWFLLQTDWPIKSVNRDFGNGQIITEQGRQGNETSTTYLQQGIYDVIAVVEFSDHPPVTQTLKIRVD